MDYKRIALQLFDELSYLYTEDICKHANLCIRYPMLANEWEQNIITYLNNIKKSENYDEYEAEKHKKELYDEITNKN